MAVLFLFEITPANLFDNSTNFGIDSFRLQSSVINLEQFTFRQCASTRLGGVIVRIEYNFAILF